MEEKISMIFGYGQKDENRETKILRQRNGETDTNIEDTDKKTERWKQKKRQRDGNRKKDREMEPGKQKQRI